MNPLGSGGPPALVATLEGGAPGRWRVRSPAVGWWSWHPRAGAPVGGGSTIGVLQTLNRRCWLLLPEEATGVVTGTLPTDRRVPVEFGQVLFELATLESPGARPGRPTSGASAAAGVREGTRAVVSPTDGVFYHRPSPEASPFVQVGSRVRTGQPVGLVEAMKTFNQILYGGPGLPDEAEVVEILCEDASEVHSGQPLLIVR